MEITGVKFCGSFASYKQCPESQLPEIALIGRSNVGKSSLINMLVKQKSLAKTSSTPGKTLLLNFFNVGNRLFIVDLPGYGFAKISKSEKERIKKLCLGYLLNRNQLKCVLLLIDLRHSQQPADKEFMEWCGTQGIPFVLIFTKADKLSRIQQEKNFQSYLKEMEKDWEEVPASFITSSVTGKGREELLLFLESLL